MSLSSDVPSLAGSGSVLSRVKAFETQSRADSVASTSSGSSLRSWESSWDASEKRSKLFMDDDGEHEEDWVSVPETAKTAISTSPATLAPPLPARRLNHAPASSVGSFHSVSLSSDTIASIAIVDSRDEHKEDVDIDTVSLGSESYESVDSNTSLGSPGAVARLTANWNQKRVVSSGPQRPQTTVPLSIGKSKSAPPPPPPRSASATLPSSSTTASGSASNGRRPPPLPPSVNRASTSTPASSDRSSILSTSSTISNSSSGSSSSIHNGYPPYPMYKSKPQPPPTKPSMAPLKPPTLKLSSSSSSSTSTSTASPMMGPGTSMAALARPTPVPSLARKRYESVFDTNLNNLNLVALNSADSKPALLSPSAALALPRKGWRGLSIDLITSDESENGVGANKDGEKDTGQGDGANVNKLGRLPGPIVRIIWSKSQLGKERLRAIWLESDPFHTGSLDKEAFVKGMWQIDAELRREELERTGRAKRAGGSHNGRNMERKPNITSTGTTSSLKSKTSAGSLRSLGRTPPIPILSSLASPSPVPPVPRLSLGIPSVSLPSPKPPPLPARKPTMGTGLGSGAGKADLGSDEMDLLL